MKKKKIKIIFAGTTNFSFQHLKSLYESKCYTISSILTKIPKNKNKIKKTNHIIKFIKKKKIPIFDPINFNDENLLKEIKKIKPHLLIIVAYGKYIPKSFIKNFSMGGINIHASILPRWRGAAPIQWAILSGDKYTGISIIKINEKIDSGKIITQSIYKISSKDTTNSILKKLTPISILLLLKTLKIYCSNYKKINFQKQQEKNTTYAPKILKKNALINWNNTAQEIERAIRAYNPWPYSFFILNKKNIKIIKASIVILKNEKKYKIGEIISSKPCGIVVNTKKDAIKLKILQIEGKKPMHISEILNSKKSWFKKKNIL